MLLARNKIRTIWQSFNTPHPLESRQHAVSRLEALEPRVLFSASLTIDAAADVVDTAVSQANPSVNYGTNTSLVVGDASGEWRSFIKWDILDYTELQGASIDSVSIQLEHFETQAGLTYIIARPDADWSETSTTWSNKPEGIALGLAQWQVDGFNGPPSSRPVTFQDGGESALRDYVQDIVDGALPNYGFVFQAVSPSGFHVFASSDSTDIPRLHIEYTPGMIDDHGDNAGSATAAGTNASTPGNIETVGDEDWFRFTAMQGYQYVFETVDGGLGDSRLALVHTDGTTTLLNDDSSGPGQMSRVQWTAPANGDYYLVVEGDGSATGGYGLQITESEPQPTVEALLDFSSPAGMIARAFIDHITPIPVDQVFTTINNAGLDFIQNEDTRSLSFGLNLGFDVATQAELHIDALEAGYTLNYDVADGSWTFASGITVGVGFGNINAEQYLVLPADASSVTAGIGLGGSVGLAGLSAELGVELPIGGVVTAEASIGVGAEVGVGAGLHLERDLTPFAFINTQGATASNLTQAVLASLTPYGDDWWADVAALAGSVLGPFGSIAMRELASPSTTPFGIVASAGTSPTESLRAKAAVQQTAGQTLSTKVGLGLGLTVAEVTADLVASYSESVSTGFTYEKTWQVDELQGGDFVGENDDHGDTRASASNFTEVINFTHQGQFETAGDIDWLRVSALQGETFWYDTLAGNDLAQAPDIDLYDASGSLIQQGQADGERNRLNWTAPTTGDYFIRLSSQAPSDTGTYGLQLGSFDPYADPDIEIEVDSNDDVTSYEFGQLPVGFFSSKTFTVRNNGDAELHVTQAAGLASPFSITPANGAGSADDWTIEPGGTQNFTLTYQPTSEGPQSDTLQLLSNDPDEPLYELIVTGQGVAPDQSDPIASYDFQGTLIDQAGNGYDGTIIGNAAYSAGPEGSALELDGASYVSLGDSFDDGSALSAAMWVNPDADAFDNAYRRLLTKHNGGGGLGNKSFSLIMLPQHHPTAPGQLNLRVYGTDGLYDITAGPMRPDTWQHVAFTYEPGEMRLYVDGQLVGSTSQKLDVNDNPLPGDVVMNNNTTDTRIGSNGQAADFFKGGIDQVNIYA
ncbi:MAG: DNRLRE domain-containing protein, partial [Phycisphaeraceae bacterium]